MQCMLKIHLILSNLDKSLCSIILCCLDVQSTIKMNSTSFMILVNCKNAYFSIFLFLFHGSLAFTEQAVSLETV